METFGLPLSPDSVSIARLPVTCCSGGVAKYTTLDLHQTMRIAPHEAFSVQLVSALEEREHEGDGLASRDGEREMRVQ